MVTQKKKDLSDMATSLSKIDKKFILLENYNFYYEFLK